MGQLVYPEIQVDGNKILEGSSFNISIHHQMAEHSHFSISCPAESLEGSEGILAEKSKDYIGSGVVIKFNDGDNIFIGVITNITVNKFDAAAGKIIISGFSPTILLEHGKDCKSYEDKKLEDIIKETIKDYPTDKVKNEIKPVFNKQLLYTVQYKESDFHFIRRLACRYGEWFYYNGQKIIIGKVDDKEKNLQYGGDLHQLSFSMHAKPQDHSFVTYDSVKANEYSKSLTDYKESVSNPYVKDVMDSSNKIFTKKPHSIYNHLNTEDDMKAQMEEVVKSNMKSTANVIQLTAVSDEVTLNVGNRIKITGDNLYTTGQEDDYGTYIITEITHECNNMGDYENRFTAIPADTKIPLYFNSEDVPFAEIQSATVTDNADPDGLGRVKVQFAWQKQSNSETPWSRVLTPHAGGSKGFYFIPEVGEEVLVDFESGNAEKPFVAGSHYNGKKKPDDWKNDKNFKKAIRTQSGHTIEFNDEGGNEEIIIYDKDQVNTIILSSHNKLMTISCQGDLKIDAENIEITARKDYKLDVQGKINVASGTETEIKSTADLKIQSDANIEIDAQANLKAKSNASTEISGTNVVAKGLASAEISAGGNTVVKGALVQIN